jgi:protein-disulfide isomerase
MAMNEHRKGAHTPTVILLEYGDYECPYDAKAEPVIEELLQEFSSDLAFLFRHFPMVNIHPNAGLAAMAAEAAHVQGKFWEMHHLLFQNYKSLSIGKIIELAKSLHINQNQFVRDLEDDSLWLKIKSNIDSGTLRGVLGTPAFNINGHPYSGVSDYESLRNAIEREIENKHNPTFR